MTLQAEYKQTSRNGKSRKYSYIHPHSGRKCTAWFPVSLIEKEVRDTVKIPEWFWQTIKNNL